MSAKMPWECVTYGCSCLRLPHSTMCAKCMAEIRLSFHRWFLFAKEAKHDLR